MASLPATAVEPIQLPEVIKSIGSDDVSVSLQSISSVSVTTFSNATLKHIAGDSGAIEALCLARERFSENAEICEAVCKCLRHIVFKEVHNLATVGDKGGIDAVVKSMKQHSDIEGVQMEGCWALVVFCGKDEQNALMAKSCGAMDVVEAASVAFPAVPDIQTKAMFLKACLS